MSCNLLLSYAFHAGTDMAPIRADLVCGLLMFDSGAFTAWRTGTPIDRAAYAEFLTTWTGVWDHAITLDVIGDPVETASNTRWLHARGLPVMPVFTPGGSLAEFDAMIADCGYVCVGGLVGLPAKVQVARCRMLQRRAQDAGGGIHALGIGSVATLTAARPYSADASTVSGAFRYGTIVFFDGTRIMNVSVTDRPKLMRYREAIRGHGIDLADLARTGRMPSGRTSVDGRIRLIQAMSLAYAAADEYLKHTGPVPTPRTVTTPGTNLFVSMVADYAPDAAALDRQLHGPHLYSSIVAINGDEGAQMVARTDLELHGGAPSRPAHAGRTPAVWAIHGRTHVCTPRKALTP